MLINPKYGWCEFNIEDFTGTPSYLTDVPIDTLQAFIDLFKKGSGCVYFDEEGTSFTLVLTPYSVFIISEQEEEPKIIVVDKNVFELAEELVHDIEQNIQGWTYFITIDENDDANHKEEILQLISELNSLYKRERTCLK